MFEKISSTLTLPFEMARKRNGLVLSGKADLQEKTFEGILRNASWLTPLQKEVIVEAVVKQNLRVTNKFKLLKILAAIPYAEISQDAHGSLIPYVVSTIWGISRTSIGSWQLNLKNAPLLNLTEVQFLNLIREDKEGIHYVIQFILEHIGLHKDIRHIFAEYNYGINSTIVYPLQKLLNMVRRWLAEEEQGHEKLLREIDSLFIHSKKKHLKKLLLEKKIEVDILKDWPYLDEDGFLGENTKKALKTFCTFLHIEADIEKEDKIIQQALKFVKAELPLPPEKEKRNWRYFIRNMLRLRLRRAFNAFANKVDVKAYVNAAMNAYNYLSGISA